MILEVLMIIAMCGMITIELVLILTLLKLRHEIQDLIIQFEKLSKQLFNFEFTPVRVEVKAPKETKGFITKLKGFFS